MTPAKSLLTSLVASAALIATAALAHPGKAGVDQGAQPNLPASTS